MILLMATIIIALTWLGYETDWMRVRLPSGKRSNLLPLPPSVEQKVKSQGKWQFSQYGDDCIMMRDRCYAYHCNLCRQGDRFFAWRIPARTVKLYGSTINFKEGCNLYRAKLLKRIVAEQKRKALPSYKRQSAYGAQYYNCYEEEAIELLVDGKPVASINGDYKRGMIKNALKPYTTKAKVGRKAFVIPVGEADRVVA